MRYGVISDVHSNYTALDKVLKDISKRNVDKVLCCGDVVGYGPDPGQCLDVIRKNGIMMVQGNHDLGVTDGTDLDMWRGEAVTTWNMAKTQLDKSQIEWLASQPIKVTVDDSIMMVHGSPRMPDTEYIHDVYDAKWNLKFMDRPICLHGHTHYPGVFEFDKNLKGVSYIPRHQSAPERVFFQEQSAYFINPGSVGQPRDGDPRAAYCIIDTGAMKVVFYRVGYTITEVQERMIRNYYPAMLWQRLTYGR